MKSLKPWLASWTRSQLAFLILAVGLVIAMWAIETWAAQGSCVPVWTDTCPCESNPPPAAFSLPKWIVLERSSNLVEWEQVEGKWDTEEDVFFEDFSPPRGPTFYRIVTEF